ncbi:MULTISPECIES: TIGR02452 family protein [unclassified Streptosporangium]|uniref:TIGR02452 family protein n=1 Tax=unclassified Streptosporangium TaxID=2632669 RepID=UPI002E27D83B|nr:MULTISPECIES: TIGR02452 family protein [unclassified Streptosporangium]
MTQARRALAAQTVEILERGWYDHPTEGRVSIAGELAEAVAGTRSWGPDEPAGPLAASPAVATSVEVVNETSLSAARRLVEDGRGDRAGEDGGDRGGGGAAGAVGCLNFASAKNPGGGFLRGTQAQEESLAYASGLYRCLVEVPDFYASHRRRGDPLYSDRAIFSPAVPVFRDDRGGLLARPYPVSFLTVAAPNAGAMDESDERRARLPEVLFERSGRVLSLFAALGLRGLVLGAWGCGVFRNSPALVAACFATHLGPSGAFRGRFERVVFAVLDDAPGTPTHDAFARALTGEPGSG